MALREIIFDTETTGLKPEEGHRIIEIGAVEMVDRFPTGKTFHHYIEPGGMEVEKGAFEVHGISNDMLKGKPRFVDILDDFNAFFGEGKLVAHNAKFDIGFFDAELSRVDLPKIDSTRVIDTLAIARRKFPGSPVSLDALCSRFGISNAHRTLHGALLDAELLSDVYIELTGGRQVGLDLQAGTPASAGPETASFGKREPRQRPNPLPSRLTQKEREAHSALLETIGENALWHRYE